MGLFLKSPIRVLLVLLNLSFICRGFDPIDRYYINCGSPSDSVVGNLTFVSDASSSRYLSTPQNILADTNSNSGDSPLYRTARIFTAPSRYTFPIAAPGRHWIRLHFRPFPFQTHNMTAATFSVFSQQTTLLSNFTPGNSAASVREYSVNAARSPLVLTFSPSPNSIAFINALELVSVPNTLFTDDASLFNPPGAFSGLVSRALETMARINMGGPSISPANDTLGRTWVSDSTFLTNPNLSTNESNIPAVRYPSTGATPETAPQTVYGTCTKMNSGNDPRSIFNVTWRFQINPGFQYFIRFHFCDIISTARNQLLFDVYIANSLVAPDFDLSTVAGPLATPYFMDFITPSTDTSSLSISIGPSPRSAYPDAFLNGIEIMKISDLRDDSLSTPAALPGFGSSKNRIGMFVGVSVGAGAIVVLVIGVLFFIKRKKKQARRAQSKTWVPISNIGRKYSVSPGSSLSYEIPFLAIQEATNNFNESLVIGVGGFGKVYKGTFSDGTKVAVKRGNRESHQGLSEFRTEIEMLSQFRHRHLVSLIGYCDERDEMILVYEYMEKGTLKEHLYGSELDNPTPALGWKERLEICIGSARGLHYLHTGYAKAVIHRDVKSANILLDENYMAKVADFGLSKTGPEMDQTHVSTAVKGSFGYLDPEYFRRQQLTDKSDVYSFGVVLFEVLCARPVIDPSRSREMVNLAEWAMKWHKKGELDRIIDPFLVGKVRPESLRKFGETAEKCLAEFGADRPSMGDVLWSLEYALQLQEMVHRDDPDEISPNVIDQIGNSNNNVDSGDSDSGVLIGNSSSSMDGLSMSRVFSRLVKSEGR